MIRRTTRFQGRVQGVGFRYTARSIARGFKVTGYVRNLPNGSVELVAEGETAEITRFLEEIQQQMDANIKNRTDDDSPATAEFPDFEVRR